MQTFDLEPTGTTFSRTRVLSTLASAPAGCALDSIDRLWVAHPSTSRVCCYEVFYTCSCALQLHLPETSPAGSRPVHLVFGGNKWEDLLIATEEGGALCVGMGKIETGCAGVEYAVQGLLPLGAVNLLS